MIHVVAGALIDAAGRVLIAQRPPGKHLAGGWEFPGGKLEPGETRVAGLERELREELGIAIGAPRPLMRLRHTYDFGDVLIDLWIIMYFQGEPRGLDGQALQWCTLNELDAVDMLPADAPLVRALRLPDRLTTADAPYYQVLDREGCVSVADVPGATPRLLGVQCVSVAEAVTLGEQMAADFLVLRYGVPPHQIKGLCDTVTQPVFVREMALEAAWALGASGIHTLPE